MDFPISLIVPELRPRSTTLQGITDALTETMIGTADTLLDADELQQIGGPAPTVDVPPVVKVNNIVLSGAPTANRLHVFQEKDGVVALLDDAYGISDTVILTEGLITLDWALGKRFLCVLSRARESAIYMAHSHAGMEITLLLINNGTDQTIGAWDTNILWSGGTAPAVPAAAAGASALQEVNLVNVNGTILGEAFSYTSGPPFPVIS